MYPEITVGRLALPAFWLAAVAGLLAAGALLAFRCKHTALERVDVSNAAALGVIGAFIGGKLLFALTMLPQFLRDPAHPEILLAGNVFYGGLLGFLAVLAVYARGYRLDSRALLDLFAPAIPLFHAFGRVGCFFNGCCHGQESARFGVAFACSKVSANGVPYLPVPLYEAAAELAILFALLVWEKRRPLSGAGVPRYFLLYAPARFLLEFLRGDAVRGAWLGLSTSQWISAAVLLLGAAGLRRASKAALHTGKSAEKRRCAPDD